MASVPVDVSHRCSSQRQNSWTQTWASAYQQKHHTCRCRRRSRLLVRAADGERFDETAASVRRLLRRDRKDLQASSGTWQPEWEDNSETPAAEPEVSGRQESGAAATSTPPASGPNTLRSPFGSAGDPFEGASSNGKPRAANPFSPGGQSANPFDDPKDLWKVVEPMESDDRPWWEKVNVGQVVLGLSFILVIVLMFATFYVTLKLGGVSLNE